MSEATSFTASFRVPFERADVFREISKAQTPLGIDTKRVNIKVTKDSKLIELIQVGCSREAEFVDNTGTTTSKLVALEDGKRVVWEELSSTVQSMRMVGIEGQPPLFTTLLTDDPRGTHVELRYDFHSVQLPGLFGNSVSKTAFPSHISDSLPEAVRSAWVADMLSRGYQKLTTEEAGLGGFEISFTLPFKRADVWAELTRFSNPLGASRGVTYSRSSDSIGGSGDELVVGMLRRAEFKSDHFKGWTLSELMDLRVPSYIKWAQVETDLSGGQLLGKGSTKPEVSCALTESAIGTSVKVKYDFYKVSSSGEMTAEKMATQFLHNAAEMWTSDMLSRGYQKEMPKFSPSSAFINRSRDQAEEQAIKARVATPRAGDSPLQALKDGIGQLFTPRGGSK
uniref:Uncharacterized protein n=1 Tax=Haptolina ericina TaxID=156174 RepID=A0A7S3B5V2_9EUKA|eukprot:CAMPEP_0181182100 /NCGR_PEP_ID=MMETSP1096-20121128/7707_1 /TAXON_ID=156174 ORGANISM="Chrysochromulina ericina, Strain CCMP281" /NCGR_SAMPLE_ID=MMETSP1096 /ASSEMBLY_ACC=CAM_ASM_000453 /LENGTH=395 /DNA_ID=CAMNT_0023270681 /DNA_START=30 /DNA_END=1217 /DNA_ORIENTATION=-